VTLARLPKALAIIGAGVIAVEFAQIFARFGVNVTILGRNPTFLPHEEPELAGMLRDVLVGEGISIETGSSVEEVSRRGTRKRLRLQRADGEQLDLDVDEILVAAGRTPNIDELRPELAGVEVSPAGIVVDPFLRTSADHVWAAGDCVAGAPRYTPIADHQGRIAAHNALGRDPLLAVSEAVVPVAIFSDPELGRVGLTEAQARQAGYAVQVESVPIGDLARGVITGETAGMVKLVADEQSGKLLGGSVLAANGGELLGEIALAVRLGLEVGEICKTIHAYPTFSEGVFWTAWEMAQPFGTGQEATRGVESPYVGEEALDAARPS
jgi:mercuric reductase